MKICVFSDFHYKKKMYAPTVGMAREILKRAKSSGVDFIVHLGDFCNDYRGSKELIDCFFVNADLPVYGVYGNHELETENNSMQFVTPRLTNRAGEVVWGTSDGRIGDGSIGYYYFDFENYRLVFLDTNYSFNTSLNVYEHNKTGCFCAPRENVKTYSLGDEQKIWLKDVVFKAAERGKRCILLSHAPFLSEWRKRDIKMNIDDCSFVCDMIAQANKEGDNAVIACFSGHWHTDRREVKDGVLFWDVNAAVNGFWEAGHTERHYAENQTYLFTDYDEFGAENGAAEISLDETVMGRETWYFDKPLSAIVEVRGDKIIIEGSKTKWVYDVAPKTDDIAVKPEISSFEFDINI